MFGIFKDGVNIASFSKKEDAYKYSIHKGWFVKDPRKLHSGWFVQGYELKELEN
jgi:hypothetical protein